MTAPIDHVWTPSFQISPDTALALIAPHLDLAIPAPLFVGEADGSHPCAFSGYRYIPDRTACALDRSDEMFQNSAEDLGRFLRPAQHTLFRAVYGLGEGDPALWKRAGRRSLVYGVTQTSYGAAISDSALQAAGKSALLGAIHIS
ncbi:MAG: hypothetical protein IT209_02730 [Armatimonadetes bacterium]|nr:hypothetical protein [Armatimonadota bacterium]